MLQLIEYCKLWRRVIKKKGIFYKDHTRPRKLGDKILILGNGPSVNLFDKHKDFFEKYDLLVVNFFPLKNQAFWTLKPRYLCLLDPWCVNPVAFLEKGYKMSNVKECIDLINIIEERVDWPLTIVSYASSEFPYSNANISYVKLSNARLNWVDLKINRKMFLNNWAIPNAQGVIVCALYFAIIFGFREIALLGVEQSYLKGLEVGIDNRMYNIFSHFYEKETVKYYMTQTYESEIAAVLEIFKGIHFAADIAESEDIKVTNYTINSYIQYFSKIDLENNEI